MCGIDHAAGSGLILGIVPAGWQVGESIVAQAEKGHGFLS
jgi:hypothetical protein